MKKINRLIKEKIKKNLDSKDFKIIVKKVVSSTNDLAKKVKNKNRKHLIISESQKKGRGRFNRVFYSPKHVGIYLSLLMPLNISVKHANKITPFVGLCVANALEKLTNYKILIKWVNDIILNDKKIGGILCESECDYKNNLIKHVIIGIGINVLKCDFPDDIKLIASSIEEELNLQINRNLIVSEIVNNLLKIKEELLNGDFVLEYKNKLNVIDKKVKVLNGNQTYTAKVVDLTDNFELVVDNNGEIVKLSSGEISIINLNQIQK